MRIWRDGQLEVRNPHSAFRNQVVRLPSEAEWERAARGTDGRIYPWSGDLDPGRANYAETGIGTTSAVGMFPAGVSPCGALDMAGNVWEWCATKRQGNYQDYRDDNDLAGGDARVVRGGSFFYGRRYVRCASRFSRDPLDRYDIIGFRVVLASPWSSGL